MSLLPRSEPPALAQLLAHELRWTIVRQLTASDLRVGELATTTGHGASLVSYHLGKLRSAGLVTVRRSAADARDNYYALDLDALGQAITRLSHDLHPGLVTPAPQPIRPASATPTVRVLFVCTGNSSRSPMAAGWLRHLGGARMSAHSAGTSPTALHPLAVQAMAEHGIDIADHQPTHIDVLARRRFEHRITVCDRAREVCPDPPRTAATAHWSVPNPTEAHPPDLDAFRATARELETRVRYLLPTLTPTGHRHAADR